MVVARSADNLLSSEHLDRPGAACTQPTLAVVPTAWGVAGVVWTQRTQAADNAFAPGPPEALLARICAPGQTAAELRKYCRLMHAECHEVIPSGSHFHPEVVPEWFGALIAYLQNYYATGLSDWSTPRFIDNWAFWRDRLDWSKVTPFQKQVLEIVAEIPRGECLTYGGVATRIGKPAAARAVGAAIGANPWPVLIPCHRVIGSSGKLTGFSAPGGIDAKRRMLQMERR